MSLRWVFLSLRHSRAESRAGGEPRVKVSARAERSTSVPFRGRRRSVLGRLEKMVVRVGRVRVDRICMYRASSWARSWESVSGSLLMATR